MNGLVVAIDGAAGSGKSTLARGLARRLRLPYINTGLMYRALAAAALARGVPPEDSDALLELTGDLRFTVEGSDPPELVIEGYTPESLTTLEVESTVSVVARHPRVRAWMRSRQRALGRSGAVMEGRDIASTVFPDAQVKLFLTAGPDERARRRVADRPTIGADVSGSLRARDELDARTNPLEPVEDAVMIDTGSLDVEATLEAALRVVRERVPDVEAP